MTASNPERINHALRTGLIFYAVAAGACSDHQDIDTPAHRTRRRWGQGMTAKVDKTTSTTGTRGRRS